MGRVSVRVQPGARREGVVDRLADGTFKVAVTAPPLEGKANEAVVEVLAAVLEVRKRDVRIVKGLSSRSKSVEVDGRSDADIVARLMRALSEKRQT